jgi:hypothetical protein
MNKFESLLVVLVMLLLLSLYLDAISTKVYRFYKPGCRYCQESQEQWDLFKKKCRFRGVKPIDVNLEEKNSTTEALANSYNVKSVPTIIKISNNGMVSKYNGDRTASDLLDWCHNI